MDDPVFRSASGLVPVFPLPGVVFFPRTILPLHVFEPRYRALVRDVMDGEGLIAVSLLLPGWDANYDGSPAFHEIGTVGRIEDVEALPDGRFNLRLVGLTRVAFGEIVRWRPYRVSRVRPLVESQVDEGCPGLQARKVALLASHGCLLRELVPEEAPGVVLDERIPFESAVNGACANLPVDAALRQQLLEEDDLSERQRRADSILHEVLERVLRLKASRYGGDGGSDLN